MCTTKLYIIKWLCLNESVDFNILDQQFLFLFLNKTQVCTNEATSIFTRPINVRTFFFFPKWKFISKEDLKVERTFKEKWQPNLSWDGHHWCLHHTRWYQVDGLVPGDIYSVWPALTSNVWVLARARPLHHQNIHYKKDLMPSPAW